MATSKLKKKFDDRVKEIGFSTIKRIEKIIARASLVGDVPILDSELFDWTKEIESEWMTIRSELEVILRDSDSIPNFQDISKDQIRISKDDKWKTFFLYGFGFKAENNCARCPKTTRIIERVPGMKSALFSILSPGKHIPAHRGPYKGVLRYHLGLIIPEPRENCRIRVDDQYYSWSEGKGIVFDDTYDHEVWNDTDGVRVVLFMDVERPLTPMAKILNKTIIKLVSWSPFVQDAKRNQEKWERGLETYLPDTPVEKPESTEPELAPNM